MEVVPLRTLHRVILQYPGGVSRQGWMRFFFHDQEHADFEPATGRSETVTLADLQAVHFVDDWETAANSPPSSLPFLPPDGGVLLRVNFPDGTVIVGRSREYDPREKGFWLRPINRPACRMVFVPRGGPSSVEVLRPHSPFAPTRRPLS